MIEVDKLVKYYGDRRVVQEMSFSVGKNEIVGLLGPNGAGKTTTMRMLTGYLPYDDGRATVAGFDVADKPMEVRKRLGYLPETVPLYTEMTVAAYLDFMAKIRDVPGKGRKRRIEEVMELCRIADVRDKAIGKLSRGYRQRVGLAQAIIHNPPVIILDEPTVGLDPRQIIEIRKVIHDLAANHSIILSSHILPEVSAICDRVVIVNRGRVLVEDTLGNLEKRGSEGERLRVVVRGPKVELKNLLESLPEILLVTEVADDISQSDPQHFDLKIKPATDPRENLAAAIVGHGWGLLEMKLIAPSLEEIFIQLITDDLARLDAEETAQPRPTTIIRYDDEMDEPVSVATATTADNESVRKAAPSFLTDDNTENVKK